jgi:predicted nucleotidyltransferase
MGEGDVDDVPFGEVDHEPSETVMRDAPDAQAVIEVDALPPAGADGAEKHFGDGGVVDVAR